MTALSNLFSNTESEEEIIFPPGDLYSNEPPMDSDLHLKQVILLIQSLERHWRDRQDFYVAGNLSVYYSRQQIESGDWRSPDFFVALKTERKPRKSWVVWEEDGTYPHVVVEIFSQNTSSADRQLKKELYEDIFRALQYFWFDLETLELEGFVLKRGRYEPIAANESGYLWSQELELYLGRRDRQLRFFTAQGELLLTPEEVADQQTQRADRLAAKLRELNIDPDRI
ncbi:Uma2 family endonuclease [Roseofilum sp. BLCC_M154]|uniref:Uma2 family endonuclease n=1 Tax=Roseofilum acuticapitatum BLCC-M154 TaxID=3022444 RepID=A0ABT7AYL2_9CYAN|nr:Uma2 family endonuclease [Roseofilum acuticapitatum]MDJ1171992.1 Uma2 family endonuclease [Roseofilum acuticapitatum BLCC-M154]